MCFVNPFSPGYKRSTRAHNTHNFPYPGFVDPTGDLTRGAWIKEVPIQLIRVVHIAFVNGIQWRIGPAILHQIML